MPKENRFKTLRKKLRNIPTRQLILMSSFIVVGTLLLIISHAASYTATVIEAENGSKSPNAGQVSNSSASGGSAIKFGSSQSCGANVANYSYQVPFGNSPWNIPACNLPVFANNQAVAANFGARVYEYASAWNASNHYWMGDDPSNNYTHNGKTGIAAQKGNIVTSFGLDGDAGDYSTPIYHANASTPRRQIKLCKETLIYDGNCFLSNLDINFCFDYTNVHCTAPDTSIPFDPSWRASGDADENIANNGQDREMIIIDDVTGFSYELWGVDRTNNSCFWRDVVLGTNGRLCVGAANTIRNNAGTQTSIYNYSQGVIDNRGMGIQNTAMIVTPEEVQAGEIRHAMTMEIFNTQYGPACTSLPATVDASFVNKTCGFTVAPATKVEWFDKVDLSRGGLCTGQADQLSNFNTGQTFRQLITPNTTIPEGMRFRLTWSDAQITAWINSRPDLVANANKAKTARIFAVALRDYGFIPGDTTCYHAGITTAGAANPDAKTKWAALGINDASSQYLLDGLFQPDNIVALNPPTSVCTDGSTTQFYCKWTSSHY